MNLESRNSLFIIGACLLWATDLLVRYPLTLKIGFATIVFIESFLGLLFILPVLIKDRSELKKLSKKDWMYAAFIGGIGMALAGFLQTACIQKATPGLFSFFQIFQPLLVVYLARRVLREKVSKTYYLWGLWIITSAVLMFSVDLELMLSSEVIYTDIFVALLTMVIWGLCTILSKRFLKFHSASILVGLRWVFAFIFSSFIFVFEKEGLPPPETLFQADVAGRFFFIGVIAGLFSMFLYYSGLKRMSASPVSFLEISYPAFGLVFSAIYTFEELTFFQLLGAGLFFAFILFLFSRRDLSPGTVGAA